MKRKVLVGHFKIQRCDPPQNCTFVLRKLKYARMHIEKCQKMCKTKLTTTDMKENRDIVRFSIMITVNKMTKIYHHPLFM